MKSDWDRLRQIRERDASRVERITREAAPDKSPEPYWLPDDTFHIETCEECGGRVAFVCDEYTCEDCGLVQL